MYDNLYQVQKKRTEDLCQDLQILHGTRSRLYLIENDDDDDDDNNNDDNDDDNNNDNGKKMPMELQTLGLVFLRIFFYLNEAMYIFFRLSVSLPFLKIYHFVLKLTIFLHFKLF